MLKKRIEYFLNHRIVENTILFFLLLGVIITIFTPNLPYLSRGADYANQNMIVYLALGMFFLVFNQKRLMVVSLICTGIFAFFLKETTDARIRYSVTNFEEKASVALINLSSIDSDPNKVFQYLERKDFDYLIFQEFTPNWKGIIRKRLKNKYPYDVSIMRVDIFGTKVFSQYPLSNIDTFMTNGIPILKTRLTKNNAKFDIFSSYLPPPLYSSSIHISKNALDILKDHIIHDSIPVIVAGVFNLVPWSKEIQEFKEHSKLTEARSGYFPSMKKNTGGIFGKPVTHLFYNPALECTYFKISQADNDEFGIEGRFQLKAKK
ncbi:MAG: endonuclease/exonuclease/phosphatase family protein [Saprospiraceae bacterium]|nr:endonuclease/exonuclease/phosphatase family protein [Saprospiraceae bacterium]